MNMFHVTLGDERRAIQEAARGHLARERDRVLAEPEAWTGVAQLGWPALLAPESDGGLGLGVAELALIASELGYAASALPVVPAAVAAGLVCAGRRDGVAGAIDRLVTGQARATVALVDDQADPVRVDDAGRLDGAKLLVPAAAGSALLVVAIGDGLAVVETASGGVEVIDQATVDPTRSWHRVRLSGATATALEPAPADRDRLLAALEVGVAADSVGVGQRALDLAVDYANEREQFGRPIGSFQAVSHRCAQMMLELEGAQTLTWMAAVALDRGSEAASIAVARAKSYASDAGRRIAGSSLQVHGGIGYTTEHEIHRQLRRGRLNAQLWSSAQDHRQAISAAALAR